MCCFSPNTCATTCFNWICRCVRLNACCHWTQERTKPEGGSALGVLDKQQVHLARQLRRNNAKSRARKQVGMCPSHAAEPMRAAHNRTRTLGPARRSCAQHVPEWRRLCSSRQSAEGKRHPKVAQACRAELHWACHGEGASRKVPELVVSRPWWCSACQPRLDTLAAPSACTLWGAPRRHPLVVPGIMRDHACKSSDWFLCARILRVVLNRAAVPDLSSLPAA